MDQLNTVSVTFQNGLASAGGLAQNWKGSSDQFLSTLSSGYSLIIGELFDMFMVSIYPTPTWESNLVCIGMTVGVCLAAALVYLPSMVRCTSARVRIAF